MLRHTIALALTGAAGVAGAETRQGFYRYPDVHGDRIVFAAEGDLWSVPTRGGEARRLTTHPGEESHPAVSPDGETLAFTAQYEGPLEVYTMPAAGGLPERRSWESEESIVRGWTPTGELVYATSQYSTLPDVQLVALDPATGGRRRLPLSQADEASFDAAGAVYFVRPTFHDNVTKRYTGGTARRVWSYAEGDREAACLTPDYDGESHSPMWWDGGVYFVTDRDGTMNVWSMSEDGGDLRQHTAHSGWDVKNPALDAGRIVYQLGADLRLLEIATGEDRLVEIALTSDFDQLREKWVKEPMQYLTSAHIHPEGKSAVLTARGRVFVVPRKHGRLVRASRIEGVRYRDAVFLPGGDRVLALTDASGELEFAALPADGVGEPEALTSDGSVLRFQGYPSPDGGHVAYADLNQDLWLLNLETREQRVVSAGREGVGNVAWSPDGRWLAFVETAPNSFLQIHLHDVEGRSSVALTSDRTNSSSPAFSPDGRWLYFLSDRDLHSLVPSPWGPRQPEPYFDSPLRIYEVALKRGQRSRFQPHDELAPEPEQKDDEKDGAAEKTATPPRVEVETEGLRSRTRQLTVPPGNYASLAVGKEALYVLSLGAGRDGKTDLVAIPIGADDPEPTTLVGDVGGYELAQKGGQLLVSKGEALYLIDAAVKAPEDLEKAKLDLSGWRFTLDPLEDWRQIFLDAWRMERDYFYDPGMHGVDWVTVRDKYLPLVDRVTTRDELSDLIGRVVGELSALHTSVRGGDHRRGPDDVTLASLGARTRRDPEAGGFVVEHVYAADPDYPGEVSPLAAPGVGVVAGDVILAVNGAAALEAADLGELLRDQHGRQVRLRVRSGEQSRDVIVVPTDDEHSLRYADWEHSRRTMVEQAGAGKVGYVHLRAMGGRDLTAWYRQFYPVFDRQGLIVDVRHNRGGNIDSIVLEKLLRRAWFYWKGRVGNPYWNMQYAFRGHMVVLVDEQTASDGEAFAEGFRTLGLGPVIGTRTWGGEIWLHGGNRLSDGGIARAPMFGVYAPEKGWLIEQRGVEPDVVVDNLPRETFDGDDAQLDAAMQELLRRIAEDPREVPQPPAYPDRSAEYE
jgi:tricorn protease